MAKSSPYDIYENAAAISKVEKVRSFRTEIDTPFAGEKTISFHAERLILDDDKGETLDAVLSRSAQAPVSRPFSQVLAEVITLTDPVTRQTINISVAGVAIAITDRYVNWYAEDKQAQEAAKNSPPAPTE